MILFASALVLVAALVGLWVDRDHGPVPFLRTGLVVLIALLPALYVALLLAVSGERIGQLRFDYVGKRLGFGPQLPLTMGGSSPESDAYEDLHHGVLEEHPPRVVELRSVPEEEDEGGTGGVSRQLLLHLESPSPLVVVVEEGDEEPRTLNAYPLEEGDRIVFSGGGGPLELRFDEGFLWRDDALWLGDAKYSLPAGRVAYLPDVLRELKATPAGETYRSALVDRDGTWHLLLREDTVSVVGEGGEPRLFVHDHPVGGPELSVALQVVWTSSGGRILKTLREDRLLVDEAAGQVEIRFADRRRLAVDPMPPGRDRLTIAVAVPGSVEERSTLELDDASPRFQGVSALYEMSGDGATLTHLGRRELVDFGRVYALGEGRDRILLRISREDMPWYLVLDLVLLGLFLLVFLGRGMVVDGALTAVVGAAGMLLANRLLFAYRAAERPPEFEVGLLAEARLALWLVPALILGFYALAWVVARDGREPASLADVAWPIAGLGLATVAVVLAGGGAVVLVPLALAAVVAVSVVISAKAGVRSGLARWRRDGLPWGWKWPAFAGVALLVLRALPAAVGMPETLRFFGQRLLWTVIQIPLAVVVVALSLALLRKLQIESTWPPRHFLLATTSLLVFLALAFGAVAVLVRDVGLLLAQAVPYAVALLAVLALPRRGLRSTASVGDGLLRWAALLLLVLPLVGVLWMNLVPEHALTAATEVQEAKAAIGGLFAGDGGGEGDGAIRPASAAIESRVPSHRMLRLYMLSDPEVLPEFGLVASERMAIHYGTLQSYAQTGGWRGAGYLASDLPRYLGDTYLSDLVPMVFVLPEQGKLGLMGLALLYLAPLGALALFAAPPEEGGAWDRRSPLARQMHWIAGVALLALAVPSLFMVLGNLNLALFTGKNCSLLGVNSLSDALESGILLGLATLGLALWNLPLPTALRTGGEDAP